MSRFELCENRDQIIISSDADGIRAGVITISQRVQWLLEIKEKSQSGKKEDRSRTQTRMRRVESRTTTTYCLCCGGLGCSLSPAMTKGPNCRILSCVAETSLRYREAKTRFAFHVATCIRLDRERLL